MKKYGEELGREKYLERCSVASVGTNSLRKKGFSESEIAEIKKNHAQKSRVTRETMMQKYGPEEGNSRWEIHLQRIRENCAFKVSFWMKRGYTLEQAEAKLKEIKARSRLARERKQKQERESEIHHENTTRSKPESQSQSQSQSLVTSEEVIS